MIRTTAVSAALLALALASAAGELELKLEVRDVWGKAGRRQVTGGVPLMPGQVKDESRLRLGVRNDAGQLTLLPAQFRALARWWRGPSTGNGQGDNSIRWVLVDFATDLAASEAKTFWLTTSDAPPPAPPAALTVAQNEDSITVTTGPARFTVDRRKFAFLSSAHVDADGDGKFADAENLLAGSPDLGTVVEDTYGQKYYSSEGTRSVEVLEQGPVRVCLRARGTHKARGGKGYSRGMYSYDCFMNFYAGSTDVYVDLVIGNSPAKSAGTPTFEDASLLLKLAGAAPECRVLGEKPFEARPAADESVCLYQDSNGADTWESCQGYDGDDQDDGWNFPKGVTPSFRGFRALKRSAKGEETAASGDHALGLMRVHTDRGGLVLHTRHFWQQFPKAIEASGDGTVRLGLFPREYRVPHFLEDTTGKGHEIVLHFFGPGKLPAGPYPADGSGRPRAEAVADAWDSRAYPRPEVEHMAACGALADIGPFTVPTAALDKKPDTRNCAQGSRMLTADDLYGNSYGWQVFGERWRSQGGCGRQGARQPMNEDDYLRRWYLAGLREWLEVGDIRSRHFRDVRGYRVEDQDPFGFDGWLTFRAANMSENRMDRPQPEDEEYRKYTEGAWKRCGFWLPNPEHNVLDLLYDRYLLMGDQRCLENMRIIAAHGGYFAAYQKPVITRDRGWGLRSLCRYWELTGDKPARAMIDKVIATYAPLVGKPPLISGTPENPNWWFTTIFTRGAAMTALYTGDETALGLCRTLAEGKEKKATTLSTLYAVLWHLTGEEQYRKAVLDKGGASLSVGGYQYISDDWLLRQPPRKKPAKE